MFFCVFFFFVFFLSNLKRVRRAQLVFRPHSFISLSHCDNQSETTIKFYNSSKADVVGNVLTLTTCVLRSDRTESVWMPTDLV